MSSTIDTRMEIFRRYIERNHMQHNQYQYDGVQWCITNELCVNPLHGVRGGFIADEMGLGKTIITIGTLLTNFLTNTLIVVPPVLMDQWYTQLYKTTGHKPIIYHGRNKKKITLKQLSSAIIVITTYGAITVSHKLRQQNVLTPLHSVRWQRIVFDEAHHLRNHTNSLYLSAKLLNTHIRWLISGTPIQNSRKDFYNLCAFLRLPKDFYSREANIPLLNSSFILKRTKAQVGISISPLHVDTTIVDWSNHHEMLLAQEIHSELSFSGVSHEKRGNLLRCFNSYFDNDKGRLLILMLKAKQCSVMPKLLQSSIDLCRPYLTDYSNYHDAVHASSKLDSVVDHIVARRDNGNSKIVFCHYRLEIDEIAARLRGLGMDNVGTFDGRHNVASRKHILTNVYDVLILQIQTASEGLNLQSYNEIYFVTPHWNPSIEDQAVARCHRIGQTKPVFVHRFIMSSFDEDSVTIEKYTSSIQDNKRLIVGKYI